MTTKSLLVILLLTGIMPCASFPYVYYFVSEKKTWGEAQTYCTSQYTALAQISNTENLTAMMSTAPAGYAGKAWIGLTGAVAWAWQDGQPASYVRWLPGQPDNMNGNEMCAKILSGLWADDSCSQTRASVCFDGTNIIIGSPMTWTNADAYCKSQASGLAKVLNDTMNTAIWQKMGYALTLEAWIGLRKTPLWRWSDSQNYTFSNWAPGQPDSLNGEQTQTCAAVVAKNGSWTDEQCSSQYPFFCYDVYKSRSAVVTMAMQSSANLEDPACSDDLLQQLHITFANNAVTDLMLTWQEVNHMRARPQRTDPVCLWVL